MAVIDDTKALRTQRLQWAEIPAELTRCTCSFCARRGAWLAYCTPERLHVTALPADDSVYRWQTRQGAHHFRADGSCTTFSDRPAFEPDGKWDGSTRRIGVNARLFDDCDAALAKSSSSTESTIGGWLRVWVRHARGAPAYCGPTGSLAH